MKKTISIACLLLLILGCTREKEFNRLTAYVDSVTVEDNTGGEMAKVLLPVYEPLDSRIPYLLQKSNSVDPREAVTAYLALTELCSQVESQPTPEGVVEAARIDPASLYKRFESFDRSTLNPHWQKWLDHTHNFMKAAVDSSASRHETPTAPGE